jgi:hypothetical protein
MNRERGYTVVELVVATAVMLAMTSAVMTLLHDGLVRTPVLEDAADLHPRARGAADALAADLRAAGNGSWSGPLAAVLPAVEPRGAGGLPGAASGDAVTVRYVPPLGARSRLTQPLDPASTIATVDLAGCALWTTACGFTAGMRALVFDAAGQMDGLLVEAIGPGVLALGAGPAPRSGTYPAGVEIVQIVEASYEVDAASRQLRRAEGGGSFAVADNVEAVTFAYGGDGLASLPLSGFQDGPFRGSGLRLFDADLLGVRTVTATLRLAGGSGHSPAVTAKVTVALRIGG